MTPRRYVESGILSDFHSDCLPDDWQKAMRYVYCRRSLGADYVKEVGYNPFLDDPTQSEREVSKALSEIVMLRGPRRR